MKIATTTKSRRESCKHNRVTIRKATSFGGDSFWQCQICGKRFTLSNFERWFLEKGGENVKIGWEGIPFEGTTLDD